MPPTNTYYCLGQRKAGVHLARIRMQCSALYAHLFINHVTDSALCTCTCDHNVEDALHYFFVCPNYHRQRAILHDKIIPHAPFNLYTILHGSQESQSANEFIINVVCEYINTTSRFY